MYNELKRELYKMKHRKLPWAIVVLLIIFMATMGVAMGRDYGKLLVMTCYNSSQIIMLILVLVGSTIFSTEFQNGTIRSLLYHSPNKKSIYFAKLMAMFLYDVFLHLMAVAITVLFNSNSIINNPVSWNSIYKYHHTLFLNMIMTSGIDLVSSVLIISIVCLTSCLINSNTIVIVVNAAIVFMGSSVSANLLNAGVSYKDIVRWNPFNMLNLTTQYYNYSTYHLTSMLSNNQLFLGTVCYTTMFVIIGFIIFNRKKY